MGTALVFNDDGRSDVDIALNLYENHPYHTLKEVILA